MSMLAGPPCASDLPVPKKSPVPIVPAIAIMDTCLADKPRCRPRWLSAEGTGSAPTGRSSAPGLATSFKFRSGSATFGDDAVELNITYSKKELECYPKMLTESRA